MVIFPQQIATFFVEETSEGQGIHASCIDKKMTQYMRNTGHKHTV
jgi:hypothetical protein